MFVKVYWVLDWFWGDSVFYIWIYCIVVNIVKNYLVFKGCRLSDIDVEVGEVEYYSGGDVLYEFVDFEKEFMRDELEKVVYDVLKELLDDLWIVVILCEFDGLSYEEIVVVMDCFVGIVCLRIFWGWEVIDKCI